MNIMGTGLWGVGFSIVQARTKKLLKRLVATPMSKAHYLLVARPQPAGCSSRSRRSSSSASRGSRSTSRCTARCGRWRALALLGALAFGGLGLLLASRARTIEAVSGLMNLVMLPMWVLSGVFFASTQFSRRDAAVHPRAAAHGAERRAARRRQRGPARSTALARELGVLTAWGTVSFALALKLFRWQ